MDFISSPVPFIVGVARCKKLLSRVESDDRVQREMIDGLSIVNLNEGKVSLTKEHHIQRKIIPHCLNMRNYWFRSRELENYSKRLNFFIKNKESSLHSFKDFFLFGPSSRESLLIQSVKLSINKFLESLSGMLAKSADGWIAYSQKDYNSERYF